MTIYHTSDLHLNHAKLIKTGFREDDSLAEMNERILDAINSTVGKEDTLYIHGDLIMSNLKNDALLAEWLKKLICKHVVVIKGNHDKVKTLLHLKSNHIIQNFHNQLAIEEDAFSSKVQVFLSHFPTLDNRCLINLHGHSHGTLEEMRVPELFDVGIDVFNKPVTLEQILEHYYGDHANPLTGFIEDKNRYTELYSQFHKQYKEGVRCG